MGAGEAARQFGALEGLKDLRQTIEAMGVQNQLTQMVFVILIIIVKLILIFNHSINFR